MAYNGAKGAKALTLRRLRRGGSPAAARPPGPGSPGPPRSEPSTRGLVCCARDTRKHTVVVSENPMGGLRPHKWGGVGIPPCEECGDMTAKGRSGREARAAHRFSRQDAEEAFDLVHPGCARRREVKGDSRMFGKPVIDRGCLVGRRVVQNHVKLSAGELAVDGLQEALKVLGRMGIPALAHDLSRGD